MNRSSTPVPAIVGVILITVFSVLCLVIFAALAALVQSRDSELTSKSTQSVSDYYDADTRAQEILASLRSGFIPEDVSVSGSEYSYSCDIDGTRSLYVRVLIGAGDYTVLEYRIVSGEQWEPEETIKVWDGTF